MHVECRRYVVGRCRCNSCTTCAGDRNANAVAASKVSRCCNAVGGRRRPVPISLPPQTREIVLEAQHVQDGNMAPCKKSTHQPRPEHQGWDLQLAPLRRRRLRWALPARWPAHPTPGLQPAPGRPGAARLRHGRTPARTAAHGAGPPPLTQNPGPPAGGGSR